jgi:ribosomal protein S18 acetylase RimI-like enzyme
VSAEGVLFRRAREDDLPRVLELFGHLQPQRGWREDQDADAARLFAEMVADPSRHLLVAEADGVVAGMLDVIIISNLSRDLSPWATFENLAVDPAFRRRGIARGLLLHARDVAVAHGCYKAQFVSGMGRKDAHRIYDGIGFDYPVRGWRRYLKEVDLTGI